MLKPNRLRHDMNDFFDKCIPLYPNCESFGGFQGRELIVCKHQMRSLGFPQKKKMNHLLLCCLLLIGTMRECERERLLHNCKLIMYANVIL